MRTPCTCAEKHYYVVIYVRYFNLSIYYLRSHQYFWCNKNKRLGNNIIKLVICTHRLN